MGDGLLKFGLMLLILVHNIGYANEHQFSCCFTGTTQWYDVFGHLREKVTPVCADSYSQSDAWHKANAQCNRLSKNTECQFDYCTEGSSDIGPTNPSNWMCAETGWLREPNRQKVFYNYFYATSRSKAEEIAERDCTEQGYQSCSAECSIQ